MLLVMMKVSLVEVVLFEVFLEEMVMSDVSRLPAVVLQGEIQSFEILLSVLLVAKSIASRAASVQLK